MKTNKERIYDFLKLHSSSGGEGVATDQLAQAINIQRTNVSSILNDLVLEGKAEKTAGRPVLYRLRPESSGEDDAFANLVGYDGSLKRAVQLAKAAVLYPGEKPERFSVRPARYRQEHARAADAEVFCGKRGAFR